MNYLADDDSGQYTAQLTRLLRDPETDNCALLLELISGGGVNRRVKGYLFGIAVFHHQREVADRAMQILGKNAARDTLRQAAKLKEGKNYYYNEAEYLGKYNNPEFDIFDFILAYKMCHWHRSSGSRSSSFDNAHQTLNLSQYTEDTLSPAIVTLDFVRYLSLPAHKGFDVAAAVPLLAQLPLERLYIENVRLDDFPIGLLSLPRLRVLNIKRGTFRPRQPMQLPPGGPYGSTSLEQFMMEGYPMSDTGRLGDFPSLTEVTFLRCNLTEVNFLKNSPLLQRLNLKHNLLESLPAFFSNFTELRSLDVSDNPLRRIELNLERLTLLEDLEIKLQRK